MEAIFEMLAGLADWVPSLMSWLGWLCASLIGAIQLSPWKGDDKALEQVKKMPLVGDLLAFLLGKSPFNK